MVTINDIAREAGVAKSTVSNVLTGKKATSKEIREKVLTVAEKYGYVPNYYAASLSNKNPSKIIGLFLEGSSHHGFHTYYGDLLKATVVAAAKEGYAVLTYYGITNEEMASKLLKHRSPVDAAILLAPSVADERLKTAGESLIPFVCIGTPKEEMKEGYSAYIDTDNGGLTAKIATEMAKQGAKNIMMINANKSLLITADRDKGFLEALDNFDGIEKEIFYSVSSTKEDGYYYASRAIRKGCDAIITANGFLASGVYEAMADHCLIAGKDIKVFSLGFSYDKSLIFDPTLSYADQDYSEFGKKAVETLLRIIRGDKVDSATIIPSKIHIHDSFTIKD